MTKCFNGSLERSVDNWLDDSKSLNFIFNIENISFYILRLSTGVPFEWYNFMLI